MPAPNLFEELKQALTEFKTFIVANETAIKGAIGVLKPLVPQIGELLTKLVQLLGQVRTAIDNLDLAAIGAGALNDVAGLTQGATRVLQAAKDLLPSQAAAIDQALAVASFASGLPSFGQVKTQIIELIDFIVLKLNDFNA